MPPGVSICRVCHRTPVLPVWFPGAHQPRGDRVGVGMVVDQDAAEGVSSMRVDGLKERAEVAVSQGPSPKGSTHPPVPEQTAKTTAINATNTIAIAISHSFLTIGRNLARCGHDRLRPPSSHIRSHLSKVGSGYRRTTSVR